MGADDHPSLLGIPLELRRPIFASLFEGLVWYSNGGDDHKPLCNDKLKSRTGVLRTCRQIRNEAFDVFNSSVEVLENHDGLTNQKFPEILLGSKKIETARGIFGLLRLVPQLPQFDRIIFSVNREKYGDFAIFLEMSDFSKLLCGLHDNDLISKSVLPCPVPDQPTPAQVKLIDAIPTVKKKLEAFKQGLIKLEIAHRAPCTIVLDDMHPWGYPFTMQVPGDDIYRIIVDAETHKVVRREINVGSNGNGKRWVAAEKVVFMNTRYFNAPVLYVPETGESRILVWKYSVDDIQIYDPEDVDPKEDVQEQLQNKDILKEALQSAIRCVPEKGKKRAHDQVE